MAFDAFFLTAVLHEVRTQCLGGRIEKIFQPGRDTVLLMIRGKESRVKLLIAANPAAPRLYLTQSSPENPPEPPTFCMVLRKHLSGAKLADVCQIPMERAVEFIFDCTDEMGYPAQKKLAVELMGRTCNLYLLNGEDRILDCLRRIGLDESSRAALPGLQYRPPVPIEKQNPAAMTSEDFDMLLHNPGPNILSDRLMNSLGGLSPLVCREAALAVGGQVDVRMDALPDDAGERLFHFFDEAFHSTAPWYYAQPDGTIKQFAFCTIHQYGGCSKADSFSALLDSFYVLRDRKDAIRQKSQTIRKAVTNCIQRLHRKIAIQEQELTRTYDRERLRQLGDILTANLGRITRGAKEAVCQDFYDPDMREIHIPLSVQLSPQQNAAKYYKDYSRMKTAEKELTHQLDLGREELGYLQSVLDELNRAQSEAELEEIRQELQSGGYIRADTAKRRIKQGKLPPLRFESTDGIQIYVGRNNRQNDELTFRMARKDDLWCHASKVHGSHVIISCAGAEVPDNTVTQAAQLAAYYAESTGGQNIPVDITRVKQVKKIPSGKPGMVIYHNYRTVVVNPYPDIRIDPLNAENGRSS